MVIKKFNKRPVVITYFLFPCTCWWFLSLQNPKSRDSSGRKVAFNFEEGELQLQLSLKNPHGFGSRRKTMQNGQIILGVKKYLFPFGYVYKLCISSAFRIPER